MGMKKTKRRIAKRVRMNLDFKVLSDTKYTMVDKSLRRRHHGELNVLHVQETKVGTRKALVKIEGDKLMATYTVITLNDTLFGLKLFLKTKKLKKVF